MSWWLRRQDSWKCATIYHDMTVEQRRLIDLLLITAPQDRNLLRNLIRRWIGFPDNTKEDNETHDAL